MTRIVAIIQARVDSTRLPNKALIPLEGQPLLLHVLQRVQHAKLLNGVVLATTTRPVDTPLVHLANDHHIPVFRGDCNDVLDRYYRAATEHHADVIVRITGDCPLIDPQIIDTVIRVFLQKSIDYVTNTLEPTYPDGLDVEVFSYTALTKAWKEARRTSEREHVTAYIRNHPEEFTLHDVKHTVDLSHLRWTVDQHEDLMFIKEIYKRLYDKQKIFYMNDILTLLQQHPEIQQINTGIQRNEGYLRSLNEDKELKKR
ncbi:MAG: glycosyltransferase family protein [Candidatus Thermoplasmatota archaeon]|nr:glycosyltransferase family protein [Candidatus Thermoplasmatota archaeon]